MPTDARDRFLDLLRAAARDGSLTKLTLGKYRGADATLKNLFVRPVALKTGPHLAFVWRHATRDITKNLKPDEALVELEGLIGRDFLDAHLFSATQNAQLETTPDGKARIKVTATTAKPSPAPAAHDRAKTHVIAAGAQWLRALGVTNERGQPREGMADKFRQIQKFAELLSHLLEEAFPSRASVWQTPRSDPPERRLQDRRPTEDLGAAADAPLSVVDMGAGKGYLTFALAELLSSRGRVRGIEARRELVELCNRIARENGFANLEFTAGQIETAELGTSLDVLIALHACDTATDDALARGVAAGAQLLVVAPCCQKELRPQLSAPPVLADALRHGIFQERQAEFVTDALRAQLLEWAGYRTKVFEFISTEHTAKNLMIAAIKTRDQDPADSERAQRIRDFAAFYGLRTQKLARLLSFPQLSPA